MAGEEPDRRFDIGAGRMGVSLRVWLETGILLTGAVKPAAWKEEQG